jgi:anti-anti-sigma factor
VEDSVTNAAWSGRRAVVTFPEHVGAPDAAQIGAQLLAAIGSGAVMLIADMSATVSCDPAGVDALIRAYQRAAASQVELRLVIRAPEIRRLVSAEGLDRLVPVYTSIEAASAARALEGAGAGDRPVRAVSALPWPARPEAWRDDGSGPAVLVTETVLRQLVDALDDGIVLASGDGTIVLANRRLAAMFGYQPGELAGQLVEALIPADLREAHRRQRAAYSRKPVARAMADRVRLIGLRKDGGTVPVTITLAPVPTAGGHLVLAVVREAAQEQQRDDLAALLTAAAWEAKDSQELLDRVVGGLFHAGLALEAAGRLPVDVARERISEALRRLDDTIHEIRDHVFRSRRPGGTL